MLFEQRVRSFVKPRRFLQFGVKETAVFFVVKVPCDLISQVTEMRGHGRPRSLPRRQDGGDLTEKPPQVAVLVMNVDGNVW